MIAAITPTISTTRIAIVSRPIWPVLQLVERRDHRAREVDDDAREDDERHAVADAALGDLLAEPHDEHRAGRQRQHAAEAEGPARLVDQRQAAGDLRLALEVDRDAERLHDRQQQRQVARVLRDLAAAELAFLRQALEVRPHHGQQLQDDRRADVRHHAQREDRDARQAAAREHVVHPEQRVLRLLGENAQRLRVHARRRDEIADAIHREHAEREQHPVAEIGDGEQILQRIEHSCLRLLPQFSLISSRSPLPCHPRRPASRRPCR